MTGPAGTQRAGGHTTPSGGPPVSGGSGGLKSEAGATVAGDHAQPSGSPPVNTGTASLLVVVLGVTAVWVWASGAALNYVRPALTPYLLASGVVLVLLGLLPPGGMLGRVRPWHAGERPGGAARVSWLLLLPALVVVLVQPAALGAHAVSSRAAVPGGAADTYPPLAPPVRGAVPMSMAEFITRGLRDRNRSLEGVRVRLVGFVTPDRGGDGYRLTRFVIFCCAADAEALQVEVRGDAVRRTGDQWLEIEGRWQPRPVAAPEDPSPPPPVLTADAVRPVAQPRRPYEYSIQYAG
jgi:uncharacterized repeat protein (TIGR03943 family)